MKSVYGDGIRLRLFPEPALQRDQMPSALSISPGGADNGRKRARPVLFIFGIVDIPGQKELPAGIPEHFFNPGVVRGFPVSCGKMVTRTVKMGGHQDAVMIAGLHIFPDEIVVDGAVLNRQPEIFFYGGPDVLRVNGAVAVRASGSGALSDTGLEVIDEVMPDAGTYRGEGKPKSDI